MRFLFVDRILAHQPGQEIHGLKHVTHDDVYLYRDHRDQYYFMPAMIGETLGQLAAWAVMVQTDFQKRPVAGVAQRVCPHRHVYVGETLSLSSFIDSIDDAVVQYHSVARVGDEVVFTIDGALGPLLPMSTFIDEALVRRQFDEINRPGIWSNEGLSRDCNVLLSSPSPKMTVPMLFDRVIESEPGISLKASKRVTRMAPYFQDHFPNKPVLPMTVLIECQLSLIQEFLNRAGFGAGFAKHYRIEALRRIKMSDFIYPGDQIVCELRVKEHQEGHVVLRFCAEVAGKRIGVMDVALIAEKGL